MGEITADTKVLTTAMTYQRVTYPKFTPIAELPDEAQKAAKERGFIEKYGKVYKPVETNIDHKREAERLQRENVSLKETIAKLSAEVKQLKKTAEAGAGAVEK